MRDSQHLPISVAAVIPVGWLAVKVLRGCVRVVVLIALNSGVALFAHDPGISTTQVQLFADRIDLTTGFAPADAETLLPEKLRTGDTWTEAQLETARDALHAIASQLWDVGAGGKLHPPRRIRLELSTGDALNFHLEYPRVDSATLTLRARKLGELPSGHRQFVIVSDERGSTITKKLLSARDNLIEVPLAGAATATEAPSVNSGGHTFWGFVRLGVEHIWTGYDHLLFLLALLIVCRSFRSSVAIISCFTVAHSLTLAAATANLVHLSGRVVEPLIAASIVFVGAENLWRRGGEPPGRWGVTFAFGLIHGFGFATVLRDLGVGRGGEGITMPLLGFNVGVEVGQVAIATVVLPLLWRAHRKPVFARVGVPAISSVIALAGLYWLMARTIFS
ncbi:MAG: HupE/UreJ family protein [Opitutaceae bacterium]|nr:HupE/UreJ family protein [Opitutaceae bacterium]